MHLAELSFKVEKEYDDDRVSHYLNGLAASLRMNGQVCGREFPITLSAKCYSLHCLIPEADSLNPKYHNKYVRKNFQEFQGNGLSQPEITILGEDIDGAEICTCVEPGSYILYTYHVLLESPLRCGDCFSPVPLYRIPPSYDDEYYDVICWQSDYQACDSLFMDSRVLERAGIREMSHVDSNLSRSGREICNKIGASTNKPTYYRLYQYYGRNRAQELKRKCPSCNGEWLVDPAWHGFDFKCDKCHLVSNIAYNV